MNSNLDKQNGIHALATVTTEETFAPRGWDKVEGGDCKLSKEKRSAKAAWRKRYRAKRIEAKRGIARYIAKANRKEGKRVNFNSWAMLRAIHEEIKPAKVVKPAKVSAKVVKPALPANWLAPLNELSNVEPKQQAA